MVSITVLLSATASLTIRNTVQKDEFRFKKYTRPIVWHAYQKNVQNPEVSHMLGK